MHVAELVTEAETLLGRRDLEGALHAFRLAQRYASAGELADQCNGGLWQTHMLLGDFEGAWLQSDALHRRDAPDPHRLWRGEPIDGRRVVVRCLHGFGDAIQMLRFAPMLERRAAAVAYEVAPHLLPLAPSLGLRDVFTWGAAAPAQPPSFDVQVELMQLPYLFRITCEELPTAQGYLKLPRQAVDRAAKQMGKRSGPRVGVAWLAGEWNPSRSLELDTLAPLLQKGSLEWWSLANGSGAPPAHPLRSQVEITGPGLLALAATIANLDLVITVDTLAAHLAGALGVPTCLLLQHAADWRWMHQRADSPWYTSLELFRQPDAGDWVGAVAQLQRRLDSLNV